MCSLLLPSIIIVAYHLISPVLLFFYPQNTYVVIVSVAMATNQLDEKTQRAIRTSLENFKLEHLALLGIYADEPGLETTQKVLSSPLIEPSDARVIEALFYPVSSFRVIW